MQTAGVCLKLSRLLFRQRGDGVQQQVGFVVHVLRKQ